MSKMRIAKATLAGLACSLLFCSATVAGDIKPNPRMDQWMTRIGTCEFPTLDRCEPLKAAVKKGSGMVAYASQVLLVGKDTTLRLGAAIYLQQFPQPDGTRALAMQWTRERQKEVRAAISSALKGLGEAPLVRLVRAMHESGDPSERVIGSNLIGDFGLQSAARDLVSGANDPEPRVQYASVDAMGKLAQDPAILEKLTIILADADVPRPLRHKAIKAAGALKYRELAPLISLSLAEPENEIRKVAAEVLATMESHWAIPALMELLGSPSTAAAGAQALAQFKDDSAVEPIRKALGLDGMQLRDQVLILKALGALGNPSITPHLIQMIESPRTDLTYHIINTLGVLRDRRAILPLILAMKNPDPRVQEIALWSLEQITGEKLGFNNQVWLDWYKDTKAGPASP